jgi:hypothetical protein
MLDLTPNAQPTHGAARFVGMPWAEAWNCWHLVQAVQAQVFGRKLPLIPVGADADQTAALLAVTAGWSRAAEPARDGDVITMLGAEGLHVGVIVEGSVLHNVGGRREDGTLWGGVRCDSIEGLARLGYGHLKLWRAQA